MHFVTELSLLFTQHNMCLCKRECSYFGQYVLGTPVSYPDIVQNTDWIPLDFDPKSCVEFCQNMLAAANVQVFA